MKTLILIISIVTLSLSVYPQSDTVTIQPCNSKQLYCVDNFLLIEKLGEKVKVIKNTPQYEGESAEIVKYFTPIEINKDKAKDLVFRMYVSILINCKGEVGEYKIISESEENSKYVEDTILEFLKKMPNKWKPAKYKGEDVDCYQVIVFTILNGMITNIFYK
jgi:hypothetical protein